MVMRGGDVKCDVCGHWIPGECRFHESLLVCQTCYDTLTKVEEEKRRIPTVAFLTLFVVSSGISYFVDTWPLVDAAAFITAGCTLPVILFRGCDYLTRRKA